MEPLPPHTHTPESAIQLRYPDGWREIMEAPDAWDYQAWMEKLTNMAQQRLRETGIEWAENRTTITARWQHAIELVADVVIDPEDICSMSQTDIVETALLTLQANLEGIGWDEVGLAFTVPNMFTGEEATINLRELP